MGIECGDWMWVVERNSFSLETQLVEMEPNSSKVPVLLFHRLRMKWCGGKNNG